MKHLRLLLIVLLSVVFITGCVNKETDKGVTGDEKVTLTISSAASLNKVLSEMKSTYEKNHPNVELLLNFGSSGSLQQQIKQGAPVDLFFSAAEKPFKELLSENLIDEKSYSNLIENSIVLITPKNIEIESVEDLTKNNIEKIAYGTPETVPVGFYAKQSLLSLNLWNSVKGKMIQAKDVLQIITYIESGNVDAGFVYQTDVLDSDKVKVISVIDDSFHDPIVYPAGVIKDTKNYEEAVEFYSFLKTETAKDIFEKYGFRVLE